MRIRGLFQLPKDPQLSLVPAPLANLKDRVMKQISGPATSTPLDSSHRELIQELLQIINDLSDAKWNSSSGLNISLTSSGSSDWEDIEDYTPPEDPPLGGVLPIAETSQLKYCPFTKTHDCMNCE
ncbi:ORF3 [Torque teno felis virus-Fc-TTV2]|uniref:ORF3 n=1 Tax=Torque teno felis virus-Fc-TTV2 TaxID=1138484 RepID=A0A678MGV3_9VIRU|nr:ORF3 [Torque teno felis virus-Fc-TTV2]AEZ53065.1 ORF3 [Torque teno felis virus-Fc-TTV2]